MNVTAVPTGTVWVSYRGNTVHATPHCSVVTRTGGSLRPYTLAILLAQGEVAAGRLKNCRRCGGLDASEIAEQAAADEAERIRTAVRDAVQRAKAHAAEFDPRGVYGTAERNLFASVLGLLDYAVRELTSDAELAAATRALQDELNKPENRI